MYKLIACDLDETLISMDRTISKGNIEAIQRLQNYDVKFVLATGRGYNTVQNTLESIGLLEKENEYVISFNGCALTENKGNKLLHWDGLPFEKVSLLYRLGLKYNVCIQVYTKDNIYVYNITDEEVTYLKGRQEMTFIDCDNIDFLKDEPIAKILYSNIDVPYLRQIASEIEEYTQDCDVSYSSNRYLEFNKKGVNKGEGLKQLAKLLNIDIKDTIAIGDNFNDLPMIKVAGLGVGVANTAKDMKPLCDYICEHDNDHDAIKEVIEKYIINY